jgi:hypothetical protein
MAPKREKTIEELSVNLDMSNSEIDKLFREFFRVLKVLKIARNMSSYEKYVIAHQLRSDIEASSWIVEICESSLVCVEKINAKIAELVLRYICNHRLSSYYLHHLDEELTQFEKLIEGECLIIPEGLVSLIYRFSGYITPERKPEGIELFLQLTRTYRSKDEQYEKLRDIWQETRDLCRK